MRIKLCLKVSICVIAFGFISLQADCSPIDSTVATEELKDFEIKLSCNKDEFIQGESIDILAKIKNNTQDTLIFSLRHYIKNLDTDSTFSRRSTKNVYLPPLGKYYFMLAPSDYIVFSGIDILSHTLKPGQYEYYLSCEIDGQKYFSNKISIRIKTVPESLMTEFNELSYDPKKECSSQTSLELAEKYKGTFYEQQFYYKLLTNSDYYLAVQNSQDFRNLRTQAIEFNKEFILKYPNSTRSYYLFHRIMHNYIANKALVEEILISLKNSQPDCKLLEVLRNQPEYVNKQISHLLY